MSTTVRPPMPPAPPFTPPPLPPQPPHGRRLKAWQGVLIVVGGLLYWGLAAGLITALAVPLTPSQPTATSTKVPTQAPATQAPTNVPTPQPTATPQPTSTATPNPNASAPAYIAAIGPQVESLTGAFDQAGTDCSAGDITACRSDMQTVHDEVASFQTVLDRHPAPPCLKQTDTLLRQALADYHDAAELAVSGIDNESSEDLQAAGVLLDQGVAHLTDATAALKQASC